MANIYTFTGNEVIATDVPKYLNQNFSALNTETDNLSKSVVKTVNNTSPVNGNVNIVGFDSYWSANEQVSLGDIRIPKGRENSGLFFECVKAGTTGSTQPNVDTAVLADFSDVGRIGAVRWIYNIAEKDDDEIFATGVAYSRATYSALWQYVQSKPALLITEAEWQAKYTATGGKFVPYYSSGDGSSTFRTPLLCAYATGVADNSKVGTFKEAGLPSHTHNVSTTFRYGSSPTTSNSLAAWDMGDRFVSTVSTVVSEDASNSIYGKSDTVTPDTMYGVWVIKAFGLIVNADNTDVKSVLTNIADNNSKMSSLESRLGYDYIVSSWTSGTEWYRKWKSGWLEQGGRVVPTAEGIKTVTLHLPFKSDSYAILTGSYRNYYADYYGDFISLTNKKTTSFDLSMYFSSSYNGVNWKAEGVSA